MKLYLVQDIECYDGEKIYSHIGTFSTYENAKQTVEALMYRTEYEFGYDFIGELNNWEGYRFMEYRFAKGDNRKLYVLSEINTNILQ